MAAADPIVEVTSDCRGGPGGGSFGVTLRGDGEIFRWHAASRHEEPEEIPMRSNPDLTRELIAELGEIGFEQIDYRKTGDTTCSLSSRSGETPHRVSWPIGDLEAPEKIRELAKRIRGLVDDPSRAEPLPVE